MTEAMTTPGVRSTPLSRYRSARRWPDTSRRKALQRALSFVRPVVILHVLRGRGVVYRMSLDGPLAVTPGQAHLRFMECTFKSDAITDQENT